jgi:hypothetical protein
MTEYLNHVRRRARRGIRSMTALADAYCPVSRAVRPALQPERSRRLAPMVTTAASLLGLAAGGLGTSVLVQYGPAPTRLVWWLLLGVSLAAVVAVLRMPETAPRRPGVLAALRPRVAVPRQARGTFVMALPCLTAVWMLSGFYLSLGPSLAAQVLRSPDLLWGGLVIFLVAGTGAAASPPRPS